MSISHARRNLRTYGWLAALLLVSIILVAAVTALIYNSRVMALRAAEAANLESIARVKAHQLYSLRRERLVDATLIANRPSFNAAYAIWLEEQDSSQAKQLLLDLQPINSTGVYTDIVLFDTEGRERLHVNPERPLQRCAATDELLARAIATGTPQIGDIHRCTPTAAPQWEIAAPLLVEQGDAAVPVGAILLAVDLPNVFSPLVNEWPVPSASAETLVVRQQEDAVVYLSNLRSGPTALDLRMPLTQTQLPAVQAVQGVTQSTTGRDYRGVEVLAGLASVPDSPWRVVAKMDLAEIDAPETAGLGWYIGGAILVIALGTLMAVLLVLAQRQRALQQLHQAQDALRVSEERLRFALDAANEGLWDRNLVTGEVFANAAAYELFGYTMEEGLAAGDFWADSIYPEDLPETNRTIDEHLQGRTPAFRCEHRIITRSGEVRWQLSSGKVVARDAGGRPARMVGTIVDITERKSMENALRDSEEALRAANEALERRVAERTDALHQAVRDLERSNAGKNAFLAAVSHELRTPLMGVLSMSELLAEGIYGTLAPKQERGVTMIQESGQRLLGTVNSILRYTSLVAGNTPLKLETCRLADLFTVAVSSVKPAADRKQQRITQEIVPPDLKIESDPQLVVTILKMLLDNGVKFTPEFGTIGVSVAELPDTQAACITVSDTGVGMSAEQVADLFQAFSQGDKTLARRYQGIGLDLAYVHEAVRRLGGAIAVTSELDRGSQFTITLPLAWQAVAQERPAG